ncbi:unnamed protein product [Parnassius apollo]|uniref:(apollo) hypothetical protein n=1 Tax=Parnassius apollo TaxID=110799 RepID=A0A8S3W6H4_PARAO|nr:unnamed protein product [Parnassius apollo]
MPWLPVLRDEQWIMSRLSQYMSHVFRTQEVQLALGRFDLTGECIHSSVACKRRIAEWGALHTAESERPAPLRCGGRHIDCVHGGRHRVLRCAFCFTG